MPITATKKKRVCNTCDESAAEGVSGVGCRVIQWVVPNSNYHCDFLGLERCLVQTEDACQAALEQRPSTPNINRTWLPSLSPGGRIAGFGRLRMVLGSKRTCVTHVALFRRSRG